MRADPHNPSQKNNNTLIITFAITLVIILALMLLAGAMYLFNKQTPISEIQSPIVEEIQLPTEVVNKIEEQQLVNSPEEELEGEEKNNTEVEETVVIEQVQLPSLDQSDAFTLNIINQLTPSMNNESLFVKEDMIRNFVVFIENLSQGELLHKFSPVISPINKFSVLKENEQIYLDPRSYHRFDNYVNFFYNLDVNTSLAQYHVLSPLFEQVYEEVGYPASTFDESLSNAIDALIAAPTITQPIKLILPSVMYKFADPELEALPAAQKLMIRMGPENSLKLKTKLQQIKAALTEQQ